MLASSLSEPIREDESTVSNSGSIAESVGKRAMEKDTSWKSPRAELFHCAWKSARATDFHFYHSPGDGKLSLRSDSGKK